jgi:hypothetical protein
MLRFPTLRNGTHTGEAPAFIGTLTRNLIAWASHP